VTDLCYWFYEDDVSMRSYPAVVDGNVVLWHETTTTTTTDSVGSHRGGSARCHWRCSPMMSSSMTSCRTGRSRRQSHAMMMSDRTPPSPDRDTQTDT